MESLVAGRVIGSLMIRRSSHDGRDFPLIAGTDDADLDEIRTTVLISIHAWFHVNYLSDSIMAGKGCQALTIEVVVGIVLRNQSLTD